MTLFPKYRDEEIAGVRLHERQAEIGNHPLDHALRDEMHSHVRRVELRGIELQAHRFEQVEMPVEVVEGNDTDSSRLEDALDLGKVGVDLQGREMHEDIVREDAAHGSVVKPSKGKPVKQVVGDVSGYDALGVGAQHFLRDIARENVVEPCARRGSDAASTAADLERRAAGRVLAKERKEYFFILPLGADERPLRGIPFLDVAIPIGAVIGLGSHEAQSSRFESRIHKSADKALHKVARIPQWP